MDTLLSTAKIWIEYLARSVEVAAALIIGIAAVQATVRSLFLFFRPGAPPEAKNGVRLTLGRWLAVALELELAADILNTAVTPSWTDIEKLAAIATTFGSGSSHGECRYLHANRRSGWLCY